MRAVGLLHGFRNQGQKNLNRREFNLSKTNYKELINIEKGCDIWNLNFQNAAFKMMPNKILKELNS